MADMAALNDATGFQYNYMEYLVEQLSVVRAARRS
jgi:hypothetical protein